MGNPLLRDPDVCPICSGSRDRLDLPIQDPVWRCKDCGHVERLHPQSSFDYHRSDYRRNFRRQSNELDDDGLVQEEFHVIRSRIVARRLRRIGQWLRPGDRCLDVGSGAGTFATAVRPMVTSVVGIEVDPNLVEETQALGFECLETDFFTAPLQPQYDVVFLWHVLEHLQEPQAVRDRVLELGPRLLVLEVPHSRKFRDRFDGHYHFYTPHSLEILFQGSRKVLIEPGIQEPAWLAVFEPVPERPAAGPCTGPAVTTRSGRINIVVGDASFEMGDYELAGLQYAAASHAGTEPKPLKLAICHWMNEDPSAEKALLETDIDDLNGLQGKNLLQHLASLYRKHKDWKRAVFCLERALSVEPAHDPTTFLELFRTLVLAGRPFEAGTTLHDALERCQNALPLMESGVVYLKQAGLDPKPLADRAIAILRRTTPDGGGHQERRKQDLAERRIDALRGFAGPDEGSAPDSPESAIVRVKASPDLMPPPLNEAFARWALMDDPVSGELLREAPPEALSALESTILLYRLAFFYRKLRDWHRTVVCLERVIAVDPEHSETGHCELVRTYLTSRKFSSANASLQQALELYPDSVLLLELAALHAKNLKWDPQPFAQRSWALLSEGVGKRQKTLPAVRREALRLLASGPEIRPDTISLS